MSARKRHTEALDFMRAFMIQERSGPWGLGGPGHRDMIAKLVKRGWLMWERDQGYKTGSFRPSLQRKNRIRSTAKGRRAVYCADRNAEPHMRPHQWDQQGGWGRVLTLDFFHRRRLDRIAELSARAQTLHPSRKKA